MMFVSFCNNESFFISLKRQVRTNEKVIIKTIPNTI